MASATSLLASMLLEKLNNEDETIEERIKLAGKIFNSTNLPLNRKEELILKWIIDEIGSKNLSEKIRKKFFNFLEKCLSSPRIQIHEVEIRPSICEDICQVLQTWGYHSSNCSIDVSQRCVLFTTKSLIFHNFFKKNVIAFSKLIVCYFNSVSETSSVENCSFIVQYIIDLFNGTLLKRDLQELFADKILFSIVNALVTIDEIYDSDFERNTYSSICKILFSDQAAAICYIKGLRDINSVKENPDKYVLLQKFLKLPKKYSLPVVEYLYPKFLQAFASNSKDENSKFEMLAFLCGIIGFKPNQECVSSMVKSYEDFEGITVLFKMLNVVTELNFSIDAEINDVYLSSWLVSLLYSFEKEECLSTNLVKVIREIILLLDPVVAEQMLSYFVKRVMLISKRSDYLISVYCDTLKDILNIFIKLSRIQSFLSKILMEAISCLSNLENNENNQYVDITLEDIFPKTFLKELSDAINTQPTASGFLALTILQYNIKKHLIPIEFETIGNVVTVEMIFKLTSHILQGIWAAEHTVPATVKEKFIFILEDFSKILRDFGMLLMDRPHNNRIAAAYFNLCGTWGAMSLMMKNYSYDEKNLIEKQTNTSASNLAYVLKFLPDTSWDILVNKTIRAGDISAKHALFQLLEQKMSALRESEEGREGPASQSTFFLLDNADDNWICEHANSLLPFLGPEEMLSLATTLSQYKYHHKIITLLHTDEFQENNDMVAAMGLTLLAEISKKCYSAGRSLLRNMFSELLLLTIVNNEADHSASEEIKSNLCNVAVILTNGIKGDEYTTDFEISPFIQRKLELLSDLPLCYLLPQTQVALLLVLFAAAKCLPYHVVVYDIITGILDNRHPLELPETLSWSVLLQWIAENTKEYLNRLMLFKCLLKSAFRNSSSMGDLIHSLSANRSEPNIILCAIIATNIEKVIKKKRNIDGETKSYLQETCHKDLYSCIKMVAQKEPSISWLPVYHMACYYHFNPKNIVVDLKAHKKLLELLPDYLNIIINHIESLKEDNNDDNSTINNPYCDDSNNGYLEIEGEFLALILQNRKKFEITLPDLLITTSWTELAGHLPVQKLQFFLQAATIDEFKNILENLTQMTTQLLHNSSLERKVCLLWKVLLVAQLQCEKIILRNAAIDQLSNTMLQLVFQWKESKSVLNVHSLLVVLITSLKVKMNIQHVEMCLEVISATPLDASPKLVNKLTAILSTILRYRTALIIDLIPQFLQRFMYIVSIVSAASHVPSIYYPVRKLADCAFSLEKLANVVMKSGKDFARVAHFAVSDILHMFELYTVESSVKIHLQNAAFCFLSLCDTHTIGYQMRILPPASKEIFKRIHSDFCKHHKFTGKV